MVGQQSYPRGSLTEQQLSKVKKNNHDGSKFFSNTNLVQRAILSGPTETLHDDQLCLGRQNFDVPEVSAKQTLVGQELCSSVNLDQSQTAEDRKVLFSNAFSSRKKLHDGSSFSGMLILQTILRQTETDEVLDDNLVQTLSIPRLLDNLHVLLKEQTLLN